MSAHDIVSRLDHCRQVSDGKWMARCPAHDDKGPSLSIRDVGDGRTLVNCFAGCGANDVLASIGFELSDLYPPTDRNYPAERKRRTETEDELVVEIGRQAMSKGQRLEGKDLERFRQALINTKKRSAA
ncbi:hypothetical protein [Haliea salexigens]|uniref:hypothetical protein n=1 Tax=Haliea salexigens TaxID=287487 RepID=UPI000488EB35|nr:hypothetical protein [Haliea salexigens]